MRVPRTEMKKARIEIIPMIDAIFFLLVFFMMTSLSMVRLSSHKVNLPESCTAGTKPEEKSKLVVSISKDNKVYVDENQVKEAELLPMVAERVKANPAITVIINCDKQQHLAEFVRVFDIVKQANAGTVMIATTPKDIGSPVAEPSS
ncbi:MAG: biopolymer transporter ExbD [Abitibacteriaceae bacterium]|nr:biopolymer transporter ExbD [Abditibacteriaceae bacterium]MBV9868680.1 biopolymer transporter ExbD [Abditibacteriaceae bacterium]